MDEEAWQVKELRALKVQNPEEVWQKYAEKWNEIGDWWERQLARTNAPATTEMDDRRLRGFFVSRYLPMLESLRKNVGDVADYTRKLRSGDGGDFWFQRTVPEVPLEQLAQMLTLVALEFGAECWKQSWIGIRENWDPPSVDACARAVRILEATEYPAGSALLRIADFLARTVDRTAKDKTEEQFWRDLRETREHVQWRWEALPRGSPSTLLLHVVGREILEKRSALSGPDVAWRWPGEIKAAALDFALAVPGMRLSVCGDTLVCTPGTCDERKKPKTMVKGGSWVDLDASGLEELHRACARISLCMRHKDFAALSLGVACAMRPLLKGNYRPAREPEVSFDLDDVVYTLSGSTARVRHALLVDGLEAAAESKRAAEGKAAREIARLEKKGKEPAGCAIL